MKKSNGKFKKVTDTTTIDGHPALIEKEATPHRLAEFNFRIIISDKTSKMLLVVLYETDEQRAIDKAMTWTDKEALKMQ